ncbi:MAG: hypothetical protein ACM3MK_00640 [Chitinophagales bacterium]
MNKTVNNLLRTLEQQESLYNQLVLTAQQQLELVKSSAFPTTANEAFELVHKRRQLLTEVENHGVEAIKLEEVLIGYYGLDDFVLKHFQDRMPFDEYASLVKQFARLAKVMTELMASDEELQDVMRHKIEENKMQPKHDTNLRQVSEVYKSNPKPPSKNNIDYRK